MKMIYKNNKFITILIGFSFLFLLVLYYYPQIYSISIDFYDRYFSHESVKDKIFSKERINILVYSENLSDEDKSGLNYMYLASFEPVTEQLGIVYIPSNTRFAGTSHTDEGDLNSIFRAKGIRNLIQRLEEQLNIQIPFFFSFKEGNFEKLINLVGGININILFPIKSVNKEKDEFFLLNSGNQVLFGPKTIEFVTYSEVDDDEKVDIVYRQQSFFKAFVEKANLEREFLSNESAAQIIYSFLSTNNLRLVDVQEILKILVFLKTYNIQMAKLPGEISEYDENEFLTPDILGFRGILPPEVSDDELNDKIRVRIINSTGISGLAGRLRLFFFEYYDIDVLDIGNRSEKGEYTVIKYLKDNYRSAVRVREVLGTGKIIENSRPRENVDIEIIIGLDYAEYL